MLTFVIFVKACEFSGEKDNLKYNSFRLSY